MRSLCDEVHDDDAVGIGEYQETWLFSLAATGHQFCKSMAAASLHYNTLDISKQKVPNIRHG